MALILRCCGDFGEDDDHAEAEDVSTGFGGTRFRYCLAEKE